MTTPLDILIIERMGTVKVLSIKYFKQEELYKKCGFKKPDDFNKQTEWTIKYEGNKLCIQVFAKLNGRANSENKYDFPPPIDNKLFYGCCAIVCYIKNLDGSKVYTNLTLPLWNKIYEKLFGGFEDLTAKEDEDEEEEDELANVPKEKKTKHGYLKDGFVVDSSDAEESSEHCSDNTNDNDDVTETSESEDNEDELVLDEIGSELSEESYDYDDKNVGN